MAKEDVTLIAHVDQAKLNQAINKAEQLVKLLKEASSLAGELASMGITLSVDI